MNNLPFEKVEREILVKKESDSMHGIDPYFRSIDELIRFGVVCVHCISIPTLKTFY